MSPYWQFSQKENCLSSAPYLIYCSSFLSLHGIAALPPRAFSPSLLFLYIFHSLLWRFLFWTLSSSPAQSHFCSGPGLPFSWSLPSFLISYHFFLTASPIHCLHLAILVSLPLWLKISSFSLPFPLHSSPFFSMLRNQHFVYL